MSADSTRDALAQTIAAPDGGAARFTEGGKAGYAADAILARFLVIPRTDRAAVERRSLSGALDLLGWDTRPDDAERVILAALGWPEDAA